jgi:hypothetical protein
LVEHTAENRGVAGSIPALATCFFPPLPTAIASDLRIELSAVKILL